MLRHDWPGNIRELRNFVERAVIFTDSDTHEIDNCATLYSKRVDFENKQVNPRRLSREVIREALLQSDWNKIKAAHFLGI
jgi:DNA-binding NtrC family response regulator